MDPRSQNDPRLVGRAAAGGRIRRAFLPFVAIVGVSLAASTVVSAIASAASPEPSAGQASGGVDLDAWKKLLFVDGEYYQDANYEGYNAGGTMGKMNLGNWPDE